MHIDRLTPYVALAFLVVASPHATANSPRFFRVASETSETAIVEFLPSGEMTWTSAIPTGRFHVEVNMDLPDEPWFTYISGTATSGLHQLRLFDPAPPAGMAYIPEGEFLRGDIWGGDFSATPATWVWVSAFYIDRTEVPKTLWDEVREWGLTNGFTDLSAGVGGGRRVTQIVTNESGVSTNVITVEAGADHPVTLVNWYDAAKWCNARSLMEGLTPAYFTDTAFTELYRTGQVDLTNFHVDWDSAGYRLPTETEWEKAARGGLIQHHFAWPSFGLPLTLFIDGTKANYWNSGDPYDQGTTPAGYYDGDQVVTNALGDPLPGEDTANAYGVYDMVGNVWEWCWDIFSATTYQWQVDSDDLRDPRGPTFTNLPLRRVERGGSWRTATNTLSDLRMATRWWWFPSESTQNLNRGFRSVRRAVEP